MLIKLLARAVKLREWLHARRGRLCYVQAYGAYKWNSEQETGYVNFEH